MFNKIIILSVFLFFFVALTDSAHAEQYLQVGEIQGSHSKLDWVEFQNCKPAVVTQYTSGSAALFRRWIGRSTSGTCGRSGTQTIEFKDLPLGKVYRLEVFPSFVTAGSKVIAEIRSGDGIILSGAKKIFSGTNYNVSDERWAIDFIPTSAAPQIKLSLSSKARNAYLYFDAFRLGEKRFEAFSEFAGTLSPDISNPQSAHSTEFLSKENNPTHEFNGKLPAATLNDMRSWIGHSECQSCTPGTTKTQRFAFHGLSSTKTYRLSIFPAFSSSPMAFSVRVASGSAQILTGASHSFGSAGDKTPEDRWDISFLPSTGDVTLEIGNDQTSGSHYLYIDAVQTNVPYPLDVFNSFAKQQAMNVAVRFSKEADQSPHSDRYNLTGSHYMAFFVEMAEMTGDWSWLDEMTKDADAILRRRDSQADYTGKSVGKVWKEGRTNYAAVLFTGANFYPMMRFARLVRTIPGLSNVVAYDGRTFGEKANGYRADFITALMFHEPEWDATRSSYVFPEDAPTYGTWDRVYSSRRALVPLTYGSLISQAQLEYALSCTPDEEATAKKKARGRRLTAEESSGLNYLTRVRRYAAAQQKLFQVDASISPARILFPYATYQGGSSGNLIGTAALRVEDTPHGNWTIRFAAAASTEGIGYSRSTLRLLANTYRNLLTPDLHIPYNGIDATVHSDWNIQTKTSTYYYHLLAGLRSDLLADARSYVLAQRNSFPHLVGLAYGEHLLP